MCLDQASEFAQVVADKRIIEPVLIPLAAADPRHVEKIVDDQFLAEKRGDEVSRARKRDGEFAVGIQLGDLEPFGDAKAVSLRERCP